jgi:hypothetical protein
LKGIRGEFRAGSQVSPARLKKVEQFHIACVRGGSAERRGQIGVAAVDPATSFSSDLPETHADVELAASESVRCVLQHCGCRATSEAERGV